MTRKLKVPRAILLVKQPCPQLTGVGGEICRKRFPARTDVIQQMTFVASKGNDRPLVKNDLMIEGVHLAGGCLDMPDCLIECHKAAPSTPRRNEAIPTPANKTI